MRTENAKAIHMYHEVPDSSSRTGKEKKNRNEIPNSADTEEHGTRFPHLAEPLQNNRFIMNHTIHTHLLEHLDGANSHIHYYPHHNHHPPLSSSFTQRAPTEYPHDRTAGGTGTPELSRLLYPQYTVYLLILTHPVAVLVLIRNVTDRPAFHSQIKCLMVD